jgi:hypothetical protein
LVRFFFRGLLRDSGKPVEGHVEAADTEAAYQALSNNGIVTETLRDDPRPLNVSPNASPIAEFADALESALDSSSSQVPFDDLTERYRGKKVWVIDRDKIRYRVAQVVDSALAASEANSESGTTARQRVANAISGLFHDTRNIASQHNADNIGAMRQTGGDLARQIGRLNGVVEQAEGLIEAMMAALQRVQSGIGPRRIVLPGQSTSPEQDGVLREIFQSNLELRRAIADQTTNQLIQTKE